MKAAYDANIRKLIHPSVHAITPYAVYPTLHSACRVLITQHRLAASAPDQIRTAGVDSKLLTALADGSVRLPHTDRVPTLPQPVSGLTPAVRMTARWGHSNGSS